MAVRNDTILMGLRQEYDRIQDMLKMDRKALEETATALKHAMTIFETRATTDAQTRLPKTLKVAQQIRSENNGNGKRGKLTQAQQRAMNMVSVLRDPDHANPRGMAPYINSGYLTRDKQGTYVLTPRGKHKLQELTGPDASTP